MSTVYSVFDSLGPIYRTGDLADLEEFFKTGKDETVTICFQLGIDLRASVARDTDVASLASEETVILVSAGIERRLSRHKEGTGGDLGVSCNHQGRNVPVQSINIPFRPYNDLVTDRGVVWVLPGESAKAQFGLRTKAFKLCSESLRTIVEAAENAVREKVLKHFPTEAPAATIC